MANARTVKVKQTGSPLRRASDQRETLIGLVLNGAFALLLEFLADRLPDLDELEAALGKPVLATVPKVALQPGNVEELKRPTQSRAPVTGQTRADPRVG